MATKSASLSTSISKNIYVIIYICTNFGAFIKKCSWLATALKGEYALNNLRIQIL